VKQLGIAMPASSLQTTPMRTLCFGLVGGALLLGAPACGPMNGSDDEDAGEGGEGGSGGSRGGAGGATGGSAGTSAGKAGTNAGGASGGKAGSSSAGGSGGAGAVGGAGQGGSIGATGGGSATGGSSGTNATGGGGGSGPTPCDTSDLVWEDPGCPDGYLRTFDDEVCSDVFKCVIGYACAGLSCVSCTETAKQGYAMNDVCVAGITEDELRVECNTIADEYAQEYPGCAP
jgi:hypothetical protein